MRFFSYISDAKVDMLLPQIPTGKKQSIAAELGFNFGLLSGKIGAQANALDMRVTRLLAVEKHIRFNERLGTPSKPEAWVESTRLSSCSVYLEGGALLWVCEGATWLLVLAGTAKHLTGATPTRELRAPYSEMAGIMTLVPPDMIQHFDGSEYWPIALHMSKKAVWLQNLADYVNKSGPFQDISFMARCLVSESYHGRSLVLASPLYVELPS
jgi:hypothetical protein